jgi:peptide subunit release factor 1 (eRF1)
MLDELLGRAHLKERIAELEAETESLERQLAAEQDRRSEAARARQDAEERENRLQDRVTELEDHVERLQAADEGGPSYRRTESLRGDRLTAVLDRLESLSGGPETILAAYVADGSDLPGAVTDAFGTRSALVARAAPCLAVTDDAGLLSATLSAPVAPEPFTAWDSEMQLERDWFEPRGSYTLALVRSDLFAMGSYEGTDRVAFHGFDSDLQTQHSKGGFSQARFERLRDAQIESHLERCRAALAERDVERCYLVGEGTVLHELRDVADRTATVDASGDPEAALDDAWRAFWTVRLHAV